MEWPGTRGAHPVHGYSPWQLHFLMRLNRLLRLQRQFGSMPHTEKYLIEILNKAMYSTYMDCQALDVGDKAREMIASSRAARGTAS